MLGNIKNTTKETHVHVIRAFLYNRIDIIGEILRVTSYRLPALINIVVLR